MEPNQVSVSALIGAYSRGYHAAHDEPKIFDDFLALQLFTPDETAMFERNLAEALKFFDPARAALCSDVASAIAWFVRLQGGPITLSRSRYVEDRLDSAVLEGVKQYVILGAGMDTFAFRRPELMRQLQVVEVDHPGTQHNKRERLARLRWEIPSQLTFVALDFNHASLSAALRQTRFDPQALTMVSWLGVTYYLSRKAVFGTLRELAALAPAGSIVIFDYMDLDAFVPERAAPRALRQQAATRQSGEPMQTGFDPATLAVELAAVGLQLCEDLGPAEIEARFFAGRADGFHAFEHVHFAAAEVVSD
jgi:methyltransferase (TIGR00027 family)